MSRPFDELINLLRNPPEDGVPETIYDDLTSQYTTILTGSEENLRKREEEIAALKNENTTLKTRNYDLLVAVGDSNGKTVEETSEDREPNIDSLFVKKGL